MSVSLPPAYRTPSPALMSQPPVRVWRRVSVRASQRSVAGALRALLSFVCCGPFVGSVGVRWGFAESRAKHALPLRVRRDLIVIDVTRVANSRARVILYDQR